MKTALIYWLNGKTGEIYVRFYGYVFDQYEVGMINGYDHELIAMFYINENELYPVRNFYDVCKLRDNFKKARAPKREILVDKAIDWLKRLK